MEGASVTEQLIGSARSNNETLIEGLFTGKFPQEVASIINSSEDPVGNRPLHVAAHNGSIDALDVLLDQEGVEIDPKNRLSGSTPLHLAVEFAARPGNQQLGLQVVDLLIECGANVTVKNSAGKRAIDIAKTANIIEVVNSLRGAQYAFEMSQSQMGEADGTVDAEEGDEGEASDSGEDVA